LVNIFIVKNMLKRLLLLLCILFCATAFADDLTATMNIPSSVPSGAEFTVEVTVNKAGLSGFMKYYMEIPEGFTGTVIDAKSGSFTVADNGVKIVWISPPAEASFTFSYKLTSPAGFSGTKSFSGKISYIKGDERMAFDMPVSEVKFGSGGAVASSAPKTEAPKPETPKTESPKTEIVKAEEPKTEAPKTETPKTEAPKTEIVKTEAPNTETPKPELVKTEAPKTEAPKTETPKPELVKTEAPKTEASKPEVVKTEAPKPEVKKEAPPVKVMTESPKVPVSATVSAGRVYKVQIGAYAKNPDIPGVPDLTKYTLDNGIVKYFSGSFSNYADASKRRTEMLNKGFEGAFIVVFENGKIVK
jgi:hypothetical protein